MTLPLRTPLFENHKRLKARMVDFHGWLMPLQYAGICEEHTAVRNQVGLFDLSHMGRVWVKGKDRRSFLQRLLTIDVDKTPAGRCRYTFFLNDRGTVLDDLIFYAAPEADLLIINASNREADLEWMKKHASGDVKIDDQTLETALLAVQGPESIAKVREILGIDASDLRYYTFKKVDDAIISRTGYTGEDGVEILVSKDRAASLWEKLVSAGIPPIGLGARDTLRTEAAMPLYGNDLDDTLTPLDAGLGFAVDLTKPEFIGQKALAASSPPRQRRVGLILESKRIARHGYKVYRGENEIGTISSGTFSYTLDQSIALAYVTTGDLEPGAPVDVDIRGRREGAHLTPIPFVRRKKS